MFDIIVNLSSGKDKARNALKTVETILIGKQIPYTVHITLHVGNATEITRELNQREDTRLIVLGGDGTYNEVLNGISNFDTITIGFIPCGTGNDFVKALMVPLDVKKALEIIF